MRRQCIAYPSGAQRRIGVLTYSVSDGGGVASFFGVGIGIGIGVETRFVLSIPIAIATPTPMVPAP